MCTCLLTWPSPRARHPRWVGDACPPARCGPGLTLHWHCPLVLLQSGSKPLPTAQWHGPHTGFPHQPLGHGRSILSGREMTGGSCCVTVLFSMKGRLWRPGALAGPLLGTSFPSSGLSFPCLLPPQNAEEFHALLTALRGPKPGRVLPTEPLFLNNSLAFSFCQEDTGDQLPKLLLAQCHHVHCALAPTPPATWGLSHTDPTAGMALPDPSPHRAALGQFPRGPGGQPVQVLNKGSCRLHGSPGPHGPMLATSPRTLRAAFPWMWNMP